MKKILVFTLTCVIIVSLTKANEKLPTQIKYIHVTSRIQSRFAITLVSSKIKNAANASKEVLFEAILPEAAFITNFTMKIGNRTVQGEVKEKEKAKTEYQAAVAAGQSAGLVSKKPRETNSFKIFVNVGAHEKVIFNLTYQEVLTRAHGFYKHIINLKPFQKVDNITVTVDIYENAEIVNVTVPKFGPKTGEKSNKELLTLPVEENAKVTNVNLASKISAVNVKFSPKSNDVDSQSGQFVVLYDVARDLKGGEIQVVNGYFVHFFAPKISRRGSKNIVFCLDKSGSMTGRKFEQTKEAMNIILSELNSDDKFNIIMFSDTVERWQQSSVFGTKSNIQRAIDYVRRTNAEGSTNIYEALQQSINMLRYENNKPLTSMILFMTDGQPTFGEIDGVAIVNGVSSSNDRNFVIHSIAFGDDADFNLVQRISSRNNGLARKVYEDSDANLQLTGFFGEISNPLLTNVTIQYLNESVNVDSVVQDFSYNYYDGGEIITVGKLSDQNTRHHPIVDARVWAESKNGPLNFDMRSHELICPYGYMIIEGDIMIPCCTRHHCPRVDEEEPKKELAPNTFGGFIERMWAYQTIRKYLKEAEINKESKEELQRKALELSLKYKFVTDLTSMVVIDQNKNSTVMKKDEDNNVDQEERAQHGLSAISAYAPRQNFINYGGDADDEYQDAFVGSLDFDAQPPPPPVPTHRARENCYTDIVIFVDVTGPKAGKNVNSWKRLEEAIRVNNTNAKLNTVAFTSHHNTRIIKPSDLTTADERNTVTNQLKNYKIFRNTFQRQSLGNTANHSFDNFQESSEKRAAVFFKGSHYNKRIKQVMDNLKIAGVKIYLVKFEGNDIKPWKDVFDEDSFITDDPSFDNLVKLLSCSV